MELLSSWRSRYTLRYIPISLPQVIFAAGTIHLLAAIQSLTRPHRATISLSDSLAQMELCIKYLSETGRSWHWGNHVCGILLQLIKQQLKCRMTMRPVGNSRFSSGYRATAPSSWSANPSSTSQSLHYCPAASPFASSSSLHSAQTASSSIDGYVVDIRPEWSANYPLHAMHDEAAPQFFSATQFTNSLNGASRDFAYTQSGNRSVASQPFMPPGFLQANLDASMHMEISDQEVAPPTHLSEEEMRSLQPWL